MDIIVNGTLSTTLEEYFSKGPLTAEEFLDAGYGLRLSGSYVCANGDRLSLLKTDEMGRKQQNPWSRVAAISKQWTPIKKTEQEEWPSEDFNGH